MLDAASERNPGSFVMMKRIEGTGSFLGGALSDLGQKRFSAGRVRFLALLMVFMMPLVVFFRFLSPGSR